MYITGLTIEQTAEIESHKADFDKGNKEYCQNVNFNSEATWERFLNNVVRIIKST